MSSSDQAQILAALIAGFAACYVATIPILLGIRRAARRGAADARAARVQVQNGHSTNLREEADERHEQNVSGLEDVKRLLRANAQSNGRRFRRLERMIVGALDRLDVLDEIEREHPRNTEPRRVSL